MVMNFLIADVVKQKMQTLVLKQCGHYPHTRDKLPFCHKKEKPFCFCGKQSLPTHFSSSALASLVWMQHMIPLFLA